MKTKLYFGILIFALIISTFEKTNAQAPGWLWAKAITGSSDEGSYSIVTDTSGNVYTTGSFSGTVDFDPGVGTFNLTSAGGYDIFISKLDPSGNFLWAIALGEPGDEIGSSIAIDISGNIYTTGSFSGTVDFDPDAGTFNLTASGLHDVFIYKLSSSGNFIWARAMGGLVNEYGNALALDASGNVYTTGTFSGLVDFDPGPATFYLTSSGSFDVFISKLNSSGNFVWAKSMGGQNVANGWSIVPDEYGNVYTTGNFMGTVDFDPGPGTFNLTSSGSYDVYISKLNSSGNFVWARSMGGLSSDNVWSIAHDAYGNIYTTGYFTGTVDFDTGPGTFNLTAVGGRDIFISKLDTSGSFVWAKAIGGTSDELGSSLVTDASGNVYTTGFFSGTVDFDPGPGTFNLTSTGIDVFISKLDSAGNFQWTNQTGGIYDDYSESMALEASGKVYVTGYFKSPSVSFGSITLTNADNSGTTGDIFIAKMDVAIGIERLDNNNGISVFPNPAGNYFTIAFVNNHKVVSVSITDITGKIIYISPSSETQMIEVNTKDFSAGVYVMRIQTPDFIETKKLVVQK